MSTFIEQLDQYGWNRRLAGRTNTRRAVMADGGSGIALSHGRSVIVLTDDEAKRLISEMLEVISDD